MSGHTPGPWREYRDDYDLKHGKHPGWIVGANEASITEYAGCGSHETAWPNPADLCLVLAAPELLAALQEIAAITGYVDCDVCTDVTVIARAAIAKATGEPT